MTVRDAVFGGAAVISHPAEPESVPADGHGGEPMPKIFKAGDLPMEKNKSDLSDYSWTSSPPLADRSGSKYLHFEVRSLHPGKFSFPYHFHRNAEELFVIFEGEATLRSPEGFTRLAKGDIIFFEEGPSGTHQLYNHGTSDCVYLDIRTRANVDVCDYPDSGKINILPAIDVFKDTSRVPYYAGEEQVREKWPEDIVKKSPSGTKAKSCSPE